ncbi:hypothetical protein FC694_17035 [Bacillus wiedmannii]|uniref:Replication-relaxation n=1 Tax=Bacillus wiedmannii TaxID=1890302 RepID=A0A4U2MTI8_9BACI|nr:replication-relaxation family protein [Bacillus wiedmannii]TKH14576.1 hypothetical protein FC694_17035 [Bacillus wiedmannii]
MLRLRDRKIIETLQLFRCMSRDQITALYFNHVKNSSTATNYVLKRLRRDQYIDVNTERKPYVYFPNPSTLKKDSQKINHYLKIIDFYIGLCQYEVPTVFEVEQRCGYAFLQPDIFMVWKGMAFFVEIQNSRYTKMQMQEKVDRYTKYKQSENWIQQSISYHIKQFPYVWIVSRLPYEIMSPDIQIIQTENVEEFMQFQLECS